MRSTLLLATFLAIIPLISAIPTRPQAARRATPTFVQDPLTNVGTYRLVDCFVDSENARILPSPVNVSPSFTVGTCLNTCVALKFPLAGVENGLSCFCGNEIAGVSVSGIDAAIANQTLSSVDLLECQAPCTGDSSQACGDFNLLLLYKPA